MSRRSSAGTLASLTLACVFGVTLLLSLAAGAGVYRRVADRVERSSAERVGLTYITAKLHGYDESRLEPGTVSRCVQAGAFGDGDAVYLLEDLDGITYETILYIYDGYLQEMMCEKGYEPGPEGGQAITRAQSLVVTEPKAGLLRLEYTDGYGTTETADVFIRSEG